MEGAHSQLGQPVGGWQACGRDSPESTPADIVGSIAVLGSYSVRLAKDSVAEPYSFELQDPGLRVKVALNFLRKKTLKMADGRLSLG
jgi:hypothetical protein